MNSQDMEDIIAFQIAWDEKDIARKGTGEIIRQAARVRIAVFKTAPRDIPRLKMEIALKTKVFNNSDAFPERDILMTELDT